MSPATIARHFTLAVLAALVLGTSAAEAAVLRLRAQCQSRGPVVTLGDVAEILTSDPQQAATLAAIELFPAPLAPRQRFVRVREIQDLLLLRGVDLTAHEFSGASQVTIRGSGKPSDPAPMRPLASSAVRSANQRVVDAAVTYLKERVSAQTPWIVEVELDEGQARLVADPGRTVSVSGGGPPWTGQQRFEVSVDVSVRGATDPAARFALDARVTTPPSVVVAARALPPGVVVHAADLALEAATTADSSADMFYAMDEVVGKETTRAIPEGKVLRQESVCEPLLVRRGDAVTVFVRNPGICVRTVGRARDNGSLDELVAVESLDDRSTYYARVSNVREVEVYGRSAKADRGDLATGESMTVGLSPFAPRK